MICMVGKNQPGLITTILIEELSYSRNNIHPIIQKECVHVSNNVGIIDLSTFSKYEVMGEGSKSFLKRLCSNTIPKKDGSIVLAHTHNDIGTNSK